LSWQKAEATDLGLLENFLLKHEIECVTFSAWLKEKIISASHLQNDLPIFINKNKNHIIGADSIQEAVLITEYGMICPIMKKREENQIHGLLSLSHFLYQTGSALSSIMGLTSNVEVIEKLLVNCVEKSKVDYYLMVLNKKNFHDQTISLPKDIIIRRARLGEAASLFNIQKQYELEEVCLNPYLFDDNACLAMLKNSLRKELVFIALEDGRPLAKAGTNARGYNVYQIGGVFTTREYRRKGISYNLMMELLKYIFKLNKIACLFVKKANIPAIMLYKKLGFKTVANFRITYI
jgi:predicted GNAT family acetyltransferase